MWQYSVLFGFQPIGVLVLHLQIHAHAVLGCMGYVCTDHPEVVYKGLCFCSYTSEFLLPLKCKPSLYFTSHAFAPTLVHRTVCS